MTIIQSITLGFIQGLTEFLPISSSAHLVIVPRIFGWSNLYCQNSAQLSFDVMLHLGSLIALLLYFRADIKKLVINRDKESKNLLQLVIIGTIPAAIIGVIYSKFIENVFSSIKVTAFFLIITGMILMVGELVAKKSRKINNMHLKDSILVGFAQAVALVPGISRSGSTIAVGLMTGLERDAAARFSFLLAIPVVLGAFIFSLTSAHFVSLNLVIVFGLASSFFFSYLAISFLIGYLKKGSLKVFAIYCLVVGLFIAIYF